MKIFYSLIFLSIQTLLSANFSFAIDHPGLTARDIQYEIGYSSTNCAHELHDKIDTAISAVNAEGNLEFYFQNGHKLLKYSIDAHRGAIRNTLLEICKDNTECTQEYIIYLTQALVDYNSKELVKWTISRDDDWEAYGETATDLFIGTVSLLPLMAVVAAHEPVSNLHQNLSIIFAGAVTLPISAKVILRNLSISEINPASRLIKFISYFHDQAAQGIKKFLSLFRKKRRINPTFYRHNVTEMTEMYDINPQLQDDLKSATREIITKIQVKLDQEARRLHLENFGKNPKEDWAILSQDLQPKEQAVILSELVAFQKMHPNQKLTETYVKTLLKTLSESLSEEERITLFNAAKSYVFKKYGRARGSINIALAFGLKINEKVSF